MELKGVSRQKVNHAKVIVAALLTVSGITEAVSIPPPTGPYQVGVRKYTIEHYNDHDPVAPNNVSTAFLATVFYPTLQKPEGPPKPYLNPETAAFFELNWHYSNGTLSSITSNVQENASFLEPESLADGSLHLPTILFGPGGGGPPVEGNTIILSELASYGYAIIGIDHPFEQPFIRYPNGTGVTGIDVDNIGIDYGDIYNMRLEDNTVFLDRHLPELVRKLNLPFSTTKLGAFGYSLGGAAALGSLQSHDRIVSGLNMDGTVYGSLASNSSAADVRKPAFLAGSEGHGGVGSGDNTWITFPQWQTGWQRKINVNGTTHHDFFDDTFWKTLEVGSDPHAGPIDGLEQVRVLNAYVKAFFDFTLLGKRSPILDGPSPEFPEVIFYNVTGSR
ncbi:hypothetical protein F4813DRAFT_348072 [Daldinia decipiens]|uniref:uncharacterized protein n=1 Tax=Daldinia decipiens TaxID=326647 RepID=UPI0020C3E49F|nr:uncharacterized protein F4813DRAFT_348072 [Daldinia decipiens]KAI1660701.1 hypothetical protein F4813DRAFT_348072 [Daldinia decipiens]